MKMNTKQIWTALTLNCHTNTFFDGVYSLDTLKEIKEKPLLIICNTDPSDKPGKHWVLFFFEKDNVEFYDSLGRDISFYGDEFIDFAKKYATHLRYYSKRTQPLNSSLCGHYCLYYAYNRCNGKNMNEILNSMPSASVVVEFVSKKFYICPKYDSCLLQNCINC